MVKPTFFLDWRQRVYSRFIGLFKSDGGGEEDDSNLQQYIDDRSGDAEKEKRRTIEQSQKDAQPDLQQKWSWVGLIYQLCGGDITKTEEVVSKTFLECLVWLSFEKEMEIKK